MRHDTGVLDTLSDIANILGLGDAFQQVISRGNETGSEMSSRLMSWIMQHLPNLRNVSSGKLNRLSSKLNSLLSVPGSIGLRDRIQKAINRTNKNITDVTNLSNNVENRITQAQNIANEAIGKSRIWAKKNEKYVTDDITNQLNLAKKEANNIEQTVI